MSLDGFIADSDGGVNWLVGDGSEPDNPGTFPKFIDTVDTVILGYKTYHQIITELSPNAWTYPGKKSYIITHKKFEDTEEIAFTDENLVDLINRLKKQEGKDIWICGGASIVNQLLEADLINRLCLSFIPTLLGKGVRLFDERDTALRFKYVSSETNNGMVDLTYERC